MKLDQAALVLVAVFAGLWLAAVVTGMIAVFPYGLIALVPIAIIAAFLFVVIKQRLENKEDDYYEKNVDK